MHSVGSGGCLAPGCGLAEHSITPYSSNSWVMSQHITPLPPHHRPGGLGYGPASLAIRPQALAEPARCSPQVAGILLRPTLQHRSTHPSKLVPIRQGNWTDSAIPPFEPRVTICQHASARTSEAELQPITNVSHVTTPIADSLARPKPLDSLEPPNGDILIADPNQPPQEESLGCRAGTIAVQNASSNTVSAAEGDALDAHPQTLQPGQGWVDRHNPPHGGPWPDSLWNVQPDCPSQPQEQQQQLGQRRLAQQKHRPGQQETPIQSQPANGASDSAPRCAPPWQHPGTARHNASLPRAYRTLPQSAAPQAKQTQRSETALRKRQRADGILLGNIFRCRTWMEMQELLRKHQEQNLEDTRRAAAAAARVAATPTATAAANEPSLPTPHLNSHKPDVAAGTTAFTARHLATALHVTAQLVPDPRTLNSVERLQLGDFVAALGRALANQAAAAPLSPIDLNMALRALARLLGAIAPDDTETTTAVAPSSAGAFSQQYPEDGTPYNEMPDAQGVPGMQSGWSGAREEHGDRDKEEDDDGEMWREQSGGVGHVATGDGSGVAGAHSARDRAGGVASQQGLHAGWLDARWADGLLEPTIQAHLQDFEPRHVSGVLWALATLRLRPRSELLAALCDQAANFAAHTSLADTSSTAPTGPSTAAPEAVMTPQGLSLTLWSLARLGFQPPRSVLQALLTACEADMTAAATSGPEATRAHNRSYGSASSAVTWETVGGSGGACGCMDLAQRCWALAVLGCQPGRRWLDLAVDAFLARAEQEQVTGQSCSMLLWGLARMRWSSAPQKHTAAPGAQTTTPTAVQPDVHADTDLVAGRDTAQVASRQQPHADAGSSDDDSAGKDMHQGIHGQQRQRQEDTHEEQRRRQQQVLGERLDSHRAASTSGRSAAINSPVGVVDAAGAYTVQLMAENLTTAAAPAEEADGRVTVRRQQVAGLLEVVGSVLGDMSSQHLATSVWAVAELGLRPSQGWLEACLSASDRQLWVALTDARRPQPYGSQALAMTLAALARLRYRPPLRWILRFLQVCRKELPTFSAHAACTLAWALAHLSCRPPGPWARAFATHTQPMLASMTPLGLSVLLWAVARWRINLPRPWLRSALMASAEQLRVGTESWDRSAVSLEAVAVAAAASGGHGAHGSHPGGRGQQRRGRLGRPTDSQQVASPQQESQTQQGVVVLQPELLTCIVWALPRLLQRRPPPAWMALADVATQAAVRHARATAAVAANSGGEGGDAGGTRCDVSGGLRDPRTLTMLLQSWAAMRSPLSEGCMSYALSCIEAAAVAAVAAGPVGHRQGLPTSASSLRLAADVGPEATSAASAAWLLPAGRRVGPQHVVLALWSCGVMGWVPPAATLSRLLDLHGALLLQQCCEQPHQQEEDKEEGRQAEEGGEGALGGLQSSSGSLQATLQQHQRLAETLVGRQAELGMMLWTLLRCGVTVAPEWLPVVLAAVGARLEAAAAASTSATATTGMVAVAALRPSSVTLLSLATLARCCLAWGVNPGSRWLAAASACLEAGVLRTRLRRRPWARAQLEEDVRYLLEQLQTAGDGEGVQGRMGNALGGSRRRGDGGRAASAAETAWVEAAAAGGTVLTNAVAAMAAGSAAAWMQGLVW